MQGLIPGSHTLFGGDEWWFFGPRIEPGDRTRLSRLAFDCRVANTRFADPTMFQRGDSNYVNQRGELVAIQRPTAISFLVENVQRLGFMQDQGEMPNWSRSELEAIEDERIEYCKTFYDHVLRTSADVEEGSKLARRAIGPHPVRTFSTEWRAFPFTTWRATEPDGLGDATENAVWLPEMSIDQERAKYDPAQADGLYAGAARGHADERERVSSVCHARTGTVP